jgi:hypothetical protein
MRCVCWCFMARERRFNFCAIVFLLLSGLACAPVASDEQSLQDAGVLGDGALLFHAEEKDVVEVTSATALELGQGEGKKLTVEGWIRIDRDLAGAVFSKRWTLDPAQTDYMLWIQPGLGLVWATGSPDDACAWMRVDLPSLGTWHHMAMTLEAFGERQGHKAFFMDGALQGECDYEEKGPAHDDDFLIGAAEHLLLFHGVHDYFSGAIDELHLNSDILYRASFEPPSAIVPSEKTVAFWDFFVEAGDQLPDLSGNGHVGRIFGAQSLNASR